MPWFSPPHAFVHQGSRPTEIYGRLCLIQLYALQDEACTSMCLSDAIIQHERIAVRRVRGSDCWHSRRYVTMAGKAEQQCGFGMEPLCSIGRKNCIAGVSSGPVQTAKTGPGSRCHRPQSAHGCCSNGDCGGGTPSAFHNTIARIYSIARESLLAPIALQKREDLCSP